MSTVFLGHTGQRLTFDPSVISTLEALRTFVSNHGIQPRNQILLTAQGKQVRPQTLLTEHELFIFDTSLLTSKNAVNTSTSTASASAGADLSSHSTTDTTTTKEPDPEVDFNPGKAPDTISNQNDLEAWQALFRMRRAWANELLVGCQARAALAERYQDEQNVIERSLGVAVASLQQHIRSGEQKLAGAETWSEDVLRDLELQSGNWEANLDSLRSIPARAEFARFFPTASSSSSTSTGASRRLSQQGNASTLQGFVDVAGVKKAASSVTSVSNTLTQKLGKMRGSLETARRDGDELLRAVDQLNEHSTVSTSSEPAQLLDEVDLVVKKMGSDLQHVQSLSKTSQSVSQASKMALLHTRNYLPNLAEFCSEMNELVRRNHQQRDNAAEMALEHMRSLSSIESNLAELYQDVKSLEAPTDGVQSMTILRMVSRLPSVYGALMVEAVRRREWVEKMKRDCETLQEEVATYQDEEVKRRRKWVQSVEDVCKSDSLLSSVLGIELSLQNEGGSWPVVSRNELHEYHKSLIDVYGQGEVTQEMEQAVKDLDKPTRKQIKHAKAFKNGSMHEAFGETSLLLRGDEQHKALREMNARLEEEVRGQKSRVRRLEDLLHRQTQISRATTGDMFTPHSGSGNERNLTPSVPPLSPHGSDEASKTGSFRHRRLSSTAKDMEEKRLARRIVDLEAELLAAKDEAKTRKNSDVEVQKQFEEAVSTKKDLMENMEAQQREFATERRGLEKELSETKERVEELENELERLVGSRDDERTGIDTRISAFEDEIARLKDDATTHAAQIAEGEEAKAALERRLEQAESARAAAETQVRELQAEQEQKQEAEAENLQLLATAHNHLSDQSEVPSSMAEITSSLEELARKSAGLVKDLMEAVAFAKSEKESLADVNERQRSDLVGAAAKQTEVEAQLRQAEERLSTEGARVHSLEQHLDEEQDQLRILRSKFADGETGSEVLRQRVAEEEAKAGKLSSELAEARSHINSLDVELMRLQKKQKSAQEATEASAERLSRRADHAKDVSQRLFAQHSRLARLLERLGLAISYQDGEMLVERASKLVASTTITEPRDSLNRTISLTSPPPTRKPSYNEDPSDLSLLKWSEALTAEEESARFEAYVQRISRFNIDTFSDALVKRLRDFEYTAKKYNKEAKESGKRAEAYKERSVKLKTEAHAKIAVKDFKEGDLALFLPTRGQAKGAWAAFNINCPHYFLSEREGMRLGTRDFIVGRISKIEQKVVDLSKAAPSPADSRSINNTVTTNDASSFADDPVNDNANDNPFDLSDGLTWWLVHAVEERGAAGAPSTPGLAKSTVAAANVDAKGSIRIKRNSKGDDASKHLNKSLDSRRSSSASKRSVAGALVPALANTNAASSNTAALSPTVATFGEGSSSNRQSAHIRDNSLGESKYLPFAVATSGSGAQGATSPTAAAAEGAASATQQPPSQQQQQAQAGLQQPHSPSIVGTHLLPSHQPSLDTGNTTTIPRPRSTSPSKSVRSLQRHLDPRSPGSPLAKASSAKTPSPSKKGSKQQQQGWESLWQAEFSVESPSKSGTGSGGAKKK